MIEIDLSKLIIPPELQNKLDKAQQELIDIKTLNEKYTYIKTKGNLWRDTLEFLSQLTNNSPDDCKCWYCECDGSAGFSFHIDHFRPKNRVKKKGSKRNDYEPGYWWLAFTPLNYRIACEKCNTGSGKVDQFPLKEGSPRAIFPGGENIEKIMLLDPANLTDPDLLVFSQDGNVQPAVDCEPIEKDRVDISIAVYNLQYRGKRIARRNVWIDCVERINEARFTRNRLKESLLISEAEKQKNITDFRNKCKRIKTMILPNAKFSKTAKACIKQYYKVETAKAQLINQEAELDWLINLL